jgi:hypothetical protein
LAKWNAPASGPAGGGGGVIANDLRKSTPRRAVGRPRSDLASTFPFNAKRTKKAKLTKVIDSSNEAFQAILEQCHVEVHQESEPTVREAKVGEHLGLV